MGQLWNPIVGKRRCFRSAKRTKYPSSQRRNVVRISRIVDLSWRGESRQDFRQAALALSDRRVQSFGLKLSASLAGQGGELLKHRGAEITEKRREADSVSSVPLCFYLLHKVYSLLTSATWRLNRQTLKTFDDTRYRPKLWMRAYPFAVTALKAASCEQGTQSVSILSFSQARFFRIQCVGRINTTSHLN